MIFLIAALLLAALSASDALMSHRMREAQFHRLDALVQRSFMDMNARCVIFLADGQSNSMRLNHATGSMPGTCGTRPLSLPPTPPTTPRTFATTSSIGRELSRCHAMLAQAAPSLTVSHPSSVL